MLDWPGSNTFTSIQFFCNPVRNNCRIVVYRKFGKAIYLGLFAEAAFLSHLLLDDISEGGCEYLYPLYDKNISVFSMMDVSFQETGLFHYLIKSFVSVFFICSIIMMALFALNQFGFEFKYKSEK